MAKKKSKSDEKKAGKGKAAKGAAKKKKGGKKRLEPKAVSTGKGASAMELGAALVQRFNAGNMEMTGDWSPKIESIEGLGVSQVWAGRKAVDAKNAWWSSGHTVHAASAEGPYVGATGFAVKFAMDVEVKETGKRQPMTEVGVYTVKNGKIVREEFMYGVQ